MIWKYLGGSMFEISSVLGKLISQAKNNCVETDAIKQEIDHLITINCGKFEHYVKLNKQKFQLVKQILSIQEKKQCFLQRDLYKLVSEQLYSDDDLSGKLNNLVRMNILAFNPTTSAYALQGNALYYGLRQYIQRVTNSESIEVFN
ncbi:MAG: hypothetical protein OMM_06080 [Candidatus Magnetoglobus multicellularis str. Araruama]|uniref:Uncharacterized protein n=1 Tax=Candidatus Magnetoglobus multicellularis str. Araruama TaxID=890399 RepID=A0A1V1NRX1_9BACT|nr:MAG: hypothetical protein OMM_06080 [Candidatus Magnetoglobus multicellularis str. Araruama]